MDLFGLKELMSNCIIRPPRAIYELQELGDQKFQFSNKKYQRIDFGVISHKTIRLQCSLYKQRYLMDPRPTVIYLHANSSNRLSVKKYLDFLIPKFDVVAFDFSGCGVSEGKYVTLGYYEKQDVRAVIQHVNHIYGKRKYLIWGRSMGAVTAILYTAKYNKICGLVLDSPFADLDKVIHAIADENLPIVPNFVLKNILQDLEQYIHGKIENEYKINFKISKLKPLEAIKSINSPIFFVASKNDKLVKTQNISKLYEQTKSFKQLQILDGGHNQIRPQHLKITIVQFLEAALKMEIPDNRRKIFSYPSIKKENMDEENDKKKENGQKRKKLKPKIFEKLST